MSLSATNIKELKATANVCRIDAIEMIYAAKSGNPGGSLSAADLIVFICRYLMDAGFVAPSRDRFILSKGHACPILYSLLIQDGLLEEAEKSTFRQINSRLQTHPDIRTPGIDFTSGSLGMGLSAAVGMALGFRIQRRAHQVYVLIGDGESQEGQVWEAAMAAAHFELGQLVCFIDANDYQQDGAIHEIMKIEPLEAKWKSFGWSVADVNGHDFNELEDAVKRLRSQAPKLPKLIIARTKKGKGVSFMEEGNRWHTGADLNNELKERALIELRAANG